MPESQVRQINIMISSTRADLAQYREEASRVNAVAIHGDYLATAGEDGIRLWDLRSLEPVPVFPSRRAFSMAIAGIILLQNVSLVV